MYNYITGNCEERIVWRDRAIR